MERLPVRLGERTADDDAAWIEHIDEAGDRPADRQKRVIDQPLGNAIPSGSPFGDLLGADLPLRMRGEPGGEPRACAARSGLAPRACERNA